MAHAGAKSDGKHHFPWGFTESAESQRYVRYFWAQVDQSGGPLACWPWVGQGGHDSAGYGQARFIGWTRKVHREAYRLTHPDFDPELDVLHTCDNPPCCNPRHLFAGTALDNLRDAAAKGRLGKKPLTWPKVRAIRAESAAGASQGTLSRRYGVSQAMVSYIVNNLQWVEPMPVEPTVWPRC
jgi:hypothetical protein